MAGKPRRTLVYAPEVRVLTYGRDGVTRDLSKDVVRGSVTRRVNAVSSASLTLNNKRNRYTAKLSRMDRIVIFLKRSKWDLVFSGYLTQVPALDVYPATCEIRAQCTLKRLMHTYWDPGLPDSADLLIANNEKGLDGGSRELLVGLLSKVGAWSANQIHVQQIPRAFAELAKKNIRDADPEARLQEFYTALGFGGSVHGVPQNTATGGVVDTSIEGLEAFLWGIREQESRNNYQARSSVTTASGAYQYLDKYWGNYGGYARAYQAPPATQDAKARQGLAAYYHTYKNWEQVAAAHFAGPTWAADRSLWNKAPGSHGTNPTVNEYVASVMNHVRNAPANTKRSSATSPVSGSTAGSTPSGPSSLNAKSSPGTIKRTETVKVPVNAQITSPFGVVRSGLANNQPHNGTDFGVPEGTDVAAALTGRVTFAAYDEYGGNTVRLAHNNKDQTSYLHLSRMLVKPGDLVNQGQVIGKSGNTGKWSTGAHLHWGYKTDGSWRNPMDQVGKTVDVDTSGNPSDNPYAADGSASSAGGITQDQVDASIFNALYQLPQYRAESMMLTGDLALINQEPLFDSVKTVANMSLRSFMSAPNGDFYSFFPDPFGLFGTKPVFRLEPIETKNLKIDAIDDPITTHVFTAGDTDMTGQVNILDWMNTAGLVAITQDYVFNQLLNIQPEDEGYLNPEEFIQKYGVRPLKMKFPVVRDPSYEYFLALHLFMEKWSAQYATRVDFTFMPELYPSMRIEVAGQGIVVYAEEVTHTFDFDTGFRTSAVISSPATTGSGQGIEGLPIGRV